jgi:hypothetical protein
MTCFTHHRGSSAGKRSLKVGLIQCTKGLFAISIASKDAVDIRYREQDVDPLGHTERIFWNILDVIKTHAMKNHYEVRPCNPIETLRLHVFDGTLHRPPRLLQLGNHTGACLRQKGGTKVTLG